MDFNASQLQAINHIDGPAMILAGPGSGKTTVITHRVFHMISQGKVDPANILVITFTKAAAREMKHRFMQLAGSKQIARANAVQFGTFHAIFFTILKHAYHYSVDNIIHDDLRYQILKELVSETGLEISDEQEFISDLSGEISRVKGERMDLEYYFSPLCPVKVFRKLFNKYQNELARRRLIDFDDMLVYTYELFTSRPDILALWQQKYSYILIDEFQDINQVQYDIIRLMAKPKRNLFIVGDDDQSIYGFRGAKPDIMKRFQNDYPDAFCCVLDVNYRSEPDIVMYSGRLVGHNKNRFEKTILSKAQYEAKQKGELLDNQRDSIENGAVSICEYRDFQEQNEAIRKQLLEYRQQGIDYKDMAVLFRTNTQARSLASKLMEFHIPFMLKDQLPNLYQHWAVQDILTYLQVALGERKRGMVARIINRPKRYVHRNAFTEEYTDFEELKKYYEDKEWMIDRIEQLEQDLAMVASLKPFAAVNLIRKGIGYDDYINEYARYRGISPEDFFEILDELLEEARGQTSISQWLLYIDEYSKELMEQTQKSRNIISGKDQEDAVVLATMHGVKGLEYDCVFIPDANEGVIPHNKAVLPADIEEERRMFYVAMTRAKKHLHISYIRKRLHKETEKSRFVEELS